MIVSPKLSDLSDIEYERQRIRDQQLDSHGMKEKKLTRRIHPRKAQSTFHLGWTQIETPKGASWRCHSIDYVEGKIKKCSF